MILNNKWTGGKVHLKLPPLPPMWIGASGVLFQPVTIDAKVGEEAALILLDDPQFASGVRLGKT